MFLVLFIRRRCVNQKSHACGNVFRDGFFHRLSDSIKIIVAETCEELLNLSDSTTQVSQLAWSPDGHQLAGIDSEGKIVVWDATRGYAYEDIQIKAKKEKEPSANRAEASKAVTSNK